MSKYFVKFVGWNENTISSLINKTIKFSTVYDFNDFNEYRYRYTGVSDSISSETHDILEREILESEKLEREKLTKAFTSEIANPSFLNNLQTLSAEQCTKKYKTKIAKLIKEGNANQLLDPKENCLCLLQENLAYSSVGIFCVSDIDVFADDSAQLMFAHYAENLKGIALIYEIESTKNTFKEITYESELTRSAGSVNRHIYWYEGNYQNIDDFLYKSIKWEYEMESRIFGTPGITQAKKHNEHNISLKAILYTPRFSGEEETLRNINKNIYNETLIIERINPSHLKHHFIMEKDDMVETDDIKVIDFLKKKFFDTYQFPRFTTRQAESKDIDDMVLLSKFRRMLYENAQPQFWRYSGKEGDNTLCKELLEDENHLMFIAENDAEILLGFIIGKIMPGPEGDHSVGPTLMIDDFCVNPEDLQSVGAKLIEEIKAVAKARGAKQILVVCGAHDHPKRKFLSEQNLSIASEWFVGDILTSSTS